MELRMMEYNKLARKLKLIPLSAENACGHDFEIKSFDFSNSYLGQFKTQTLVTHASLWLIFSTVFVS